VEKRERGFRHLLVLEGEILANDRELPGQQRSKSAVALKIFMVSL
jgi:hypothetical protein